jgi:hypothetical protein
MDQVEIKNPNENWVAADNVFPMMLYRAGTETVWDGRDTDIKVVSDSKEHATAIASGWYEGVDYAALDDVVEEKDVLDRTAKEIEAGLADMSLEELAVLKTQETNGKARKGVLAMIEAALDEKLAA